MPHHKRRRHRKQPRSVLSSSHRVFETSRDKTTDDAECSSPAVEKRKTAKPYVVEWRYKELAYLRRVRWLQNLSREWSTYRRYAKERDRDKALAVLNRKDRLREYRAKDTLG